MEFGGYFRWTSQKDTLSRWLSFFFNFGVLTFKTKKKHFGGGGGTSKNPKFPNFTQNTQK